MTLRTAPVGRRTAQRVTFPWAHRHVVRLFGPAVVLSTLVLLRLPWLHAPLVTQDESIIVVYAQQMLDGRLPHRDFYTVYGPGAFGLTAGAFVLFGSSLVVERLVGLVLQALVVTGVYRLGASRGRAVAVSASFVSVLCLSPLGLAAYAWVGGLSCIVWGLVLLQRHTRLVAAFILLALSAIFRPEMAVPALVAGLPFLNSRDALRAGAIGASVGLAPSLLFYGTWGRRAFDNVVLQRGLVNARLHIDSLTIAILCVSLAAVLLLAWSAVRTRSAEAWSRVLLVVLMVPQLVQRTDLDHLGYLMALAAPLALLSVPNRGDRATRWPAMVACGSMVGVLALVIIPSRLLIQPAASAVYEVGGRSLLLPTDEVAALDDLRRSVLRAVPAGSRLFIGTQDMRAPSVTPVQLYFLFPELRSDPYFMEMPIGISAKAGEQMAEDVQKSDVLLLSRFPESLGTVLFPGVPLGPAAADDAVRARFCPAGGWVELQILVRCKGAPDHGKPL